VRCVEAPYGEVAICDAAIATSPEGASKGFSRPGTRPRCRSLTGRVDRGDGARSVSTQHRGATVARRLENRTAREHMQAHRRPRAAKNTWTKRMDKAVNECS
jgi:hypothetical protein